MKNRQTISTILGIAATVVLATNGHAADINVPGDQATIQAGINAANPGDVVIVAEGEYFENINFNGKAITVRSTDPNDAGVVLNTIINGGGSGSVVTCDSGEGPGTVLSGFVITNGNNPGNQQGGGMLNSNSSPTVTNCTFSGNAATFGGGMGNQGSSPTVTNCTFSGNSAASGGGMQNKNNSSPTVTNCTFGGNTVNDHGGGMFNTFNSSPTVSNCTFSGNSAHFGGGMENQGSSPTVTNCTFSGNTAGRGGGMTNRGGSTPMVANCSFSGNTALHGGGMFNDSFSSPTVTNCTFSGNSASIDGGGMTNDPNTSPTVTNCTFSGNTAFAGGGMHNRDSSSMVTNCTFSGNTASIAGGGMFNEQNSPTVTNCTFSGNTASFGGGMFNECSSPTVTNCTFSGNTALFGGPGSGGGGMTNFSSSPAVTNCILWGDTPSEIRDALESVTTVSFSDIQAGFPGTGNIDADPLFVDANGPDGIPGTEDDDLRLMSGSPCIDAGDNTAVPPDTSDLDEDGDTVEPIPFDLDGSPRFIDDPDTPDTGNPDGVNPIVDMGAHEFQGAGLLANLDIKPGSCPNSFNRNSHGVLPVALVGTADFDPMQIDLATVQLTRADGVGGSVAPNEGPPGPHSVFEDVATPFDGEPCNCHELEGDGITDLSMKFKTDDVVAALQLNDLPAGDLVELVVSGTLLDGTPFSASDCIRLVPPGTPGGLLAVGSNLPGAWLDVSPLDLQLDGGGFANFERTFPQTTVVTLTAPAAFQGWVFSGWMTDGGLRPGQSIDITTGGEPQRANALYAPAGPTVLPTIVP